MRVSFRRFIHALEEQLIAIHVRLSPRPGRDAASDTPGIIGNRISIPTSRTPALPPRHRAVAIDRGEFEKLPLDNSTSSSSKYYCSVFALAFGLRQLGLTGRGCHRSSIDDSSGCSSSAIHFSPIPGSFILHSSHNFMDYYQISIEFQL